MSEEVEFRSKDFADVMLTEDDISAIIFRQKLVRAKKNQQQLLILTENLWCRHLETKLKKMSGIILKSLTK